MGLLACVLVRDWIGFVESAYALELGLGDWLGGIAARAAPLLDEGFGITALAFRLGPERIEIEEVGTCGGPEDLREIALATNRAAPNPALDLVYRSSVPVATLSEIFANRPETLSIVREASAGAFRDSLGMVAHAGSGRGIAITAPLAEVRGMSAGERSSWTRAALHVAAAYRLRLALESTALEAPSVEAVLNPNGSIADARASARSRSSREALREAVRRTERARGAERREPDAALALWTGLVRGRWSLVDHFDADGRRFVVAHRNPPGSGDPRGLTPRERDAAEQLGLGYTPKEIAYALGLSRSTIDNALSRARRKLSLSGIAELASLFAPGGLRARLREIEVAGEPMLVGVLPPVAAEHLAGLSEVEREIALALVQGATNREIAARRSSAERTVANQVQTLYRKLGVSSRAGLAALLAR